LFVFLNIGLVNYVIFIVEYRSHVVGISTQYMENRSQHGSL